MIKIYIFIKLSLQKKKKEISKLIDGFQVGIISLLLVEFGSSNLIISLSYEKI